MLEFSEPDGIPARGAVVVVPGRGEQPDVYRRLGARLAADAYRVHVATAPTFDPDATRRDVDAVVTQEDVPHPVVLIGSDTGALFAAGVLAAGEVDGVDGVVLVGLPQSAEATEAPSWDEELEARTTCPTHRGRISGESEIVTPGALYEAIPQELFEAADLEAIPVPVLAIHGEQDVVSPLATVRDRYAGAANVEFVSIAAARHDALNDQSHRTAAATVVLWLERLKLNGPALTAIASRELVGERVV